MAQTPLLKRFGCIIDDGTERVTLVIETLVLKEMRLRISMTYRVVPDQVDLYDVGGAADVEPGRNMDTEERYGLVATKAEGH